VPEPERLTFVDRFVKQDTVDETETQQIAVTRYSAADVGTTSTKTLRCRRVRYKRLLEEAPNTAVDSDALSYIAEVGYPPTTAEFRAKNDVSVEQQRTFVTARVHRGTEVVVADNDGFLPPAFIVAVGFQFVDEVVHVVDVPADEVVQSGQLVIPIALSGCRRFLHGGVEVADLST